MQPLVSIIMPTYQGNENICMAIDSALDQTYLNIEIIVVDDNGAGTEEQIKTEQRLKHYIDAGQIIYIKHLKNQNGSAARNTGARAAKGEYLAFLDDDDFLCREKIEKQVSCFQKLNKSYGMVICSGYIVKTTGIGYELGIVQQDVLYNLLCGKLRFNSSMMMVRKSAFDEIHGFDESFKRHQDWEFCARLMSRHKVAVVPEHLVVKYLLDRNVPKKPQLAVEYRMYFLDKNKDIIHQLGKEKEKQILSFHYRDLALNFLLARDIKNGLYWLGRAGNPLVQFVKLAAYSIGRKTVHREKYAKSLAQFQGDYQC